MPKNWMNGCVSQLGEVPKETLKNVLVHVGLMPTRLSKDKQYLGIGVG